MSMTINLVKDHNIYLCEGGPVYNGGVQPTPITYLTQWKIVGNSEVKTFPYPDGVVLPTGYKRCKYLEAHGTEYIELPVGFDNTDEIELTTSFTQINLSDKYAIAPKTWNDNNNRFAIGIHYVNFQDQKSQYLFCAGYGSGRTSSTVYTPHVSQDTNVHLFTYANYLFKLDNSSTKDVSSITFGGTTADLRLFYGYNTPTKCRIYSYHQIKEDETEINLIPCLDDNNIPCLYDTVSGTSFYNDGTGTFGYELYPQPTEIWSCGEYNATDDKYHILVQPLGGSIADIALTEPLRKVNNVADTIEFPSGTDGKAVVTRNLKQIIMSSLEWTKSISGVQDSYRYFAEVSDAYPYTASERVLTMNTGDYQNVSGNNTYNHASNSRTIGMYPTISSSLFPNFVIYDPNYDKEGDLSAFLTYLADKLIIYRLATPTTELVDAPQIEEADSYSMVISQGAKAVEWSSFETE